MLTEFIPKILLDLAGGYETLIKRLPYEYQAAMFANHIASQYIYQYGKNTNVNYF